MDRVVVYYHKDSDTMDIWFGNPDVGFDKNWNNVLS